MLQYFIRFYCNIFSLRPKNYNKRPPGRPCVYNKVYFPVPFPIQKRRFPARRPQYFRIFTRNDRKK